MSQMNNLVLTPIHWADLVEKTALRTAEIISGLPPRVKEETEELLTTEETTKFLKCTTTNVWRLEKSGKIKRYGLGGKRYYKKSELLEALTVVNN
jgi:hypothetical protein